MPARTAPVLGLPVTLSASLPSAAADTDPSGRTHSQSNSDAGSTDSYLASCGLPYANAHSYLAASGLSVADSHTYIASCGLSYPNSHAYVASCGLSYAKFHAAIGDA